MTINYMYKTMNFIYNNTFIDNTHILVVIKIYYILLLIHTFLLNNHILVVIETLVFHWINKFKIMNFGTRIDTT